MVTKMLKDQEDGLKDEAEGVMYWVMTQSQGEAPHRHHLLRHRRVADQIVRAIKLRNADALAWVAEEAV